MTVRSSPMASRSRSAAAEPVAGRTSASLARSSERGMRPRRIVGTSMGAIIGAALAAGRSPDAIEADAGRAQMHRLMRRRGRFALFDPRRVLEHLARELGDPRHRGPADPARDHRLRPGRRSPAAHHVRPSHRRPRGQHRRPVLLPAAARSRRRVVRRRPVGGDPGHPRARVGAEPAGHRRPGRHPEAGIPGQPAGRCLPARRLVAAGRRRPTRIA